MTENHGVPGSIPGWATTGAGAEPVILLRVRRDTKPSIPACLALPILVVAAAASADVAPGDVVTAADRDRLRGLVPDAVYALVVEGFQGLRMEIVAPGSYPPHPRFVEATARHACQVSLDEHGQLVGYVAGEPFPYSAWAQEATDHACDLRPDDPKIGLKLAWNAYHRWNGGTINSPEWGQSYWREAGDRTWKIARGEYRRTWFSHRADLLPETTTLSPGTDIEWAEYSETKHPFDMRGASFLVYRYRDSYARRDDAWAYVPTLRRVRRIPSEEKADSVQGSNFTLEDFFLFSGYVWDHDWRFLGETTLLAALDTKRRCFPLLPEGPARELPEAGSDRHFFTCRFGPHRALPLVDETWQKRRVVALEQVPRRAGHPYSRKLLWYDKETFTPLLFLAYGRDGQPARLHWYLGNWSETSGNPADRGKQVVLFAASGVVDLRDGTSNLFQAFGTNAKSFTGRQSLRYFDTNRLKKSH